VMNPAHPVDVVVGAGQKTSWVIMAHIIMRHVLLLFFFFSIFFHCF